MLAEVEPALSKSLATVSSLMPAVEALMHESLGAAPNQKGGAAMAAHQLLAAGGHRVRARIALDACLKLSVCRSDATILSACVELLHSASLVHDDVADQSEWRRGQRSVYSTSGTAIAVCTGDLLLSAAYGVLSGLSDVDKLGCLLRLVHVCTSSAIRGQCAEGVPFVAGDASWSEYEDIVIAKSGALLALPLEMALTAADHEDHVVTAQKATKAFAVAYQIMDDIQDRDVDCLRSPSFNALLILEAAGHGDSAAGIASDFAKFRLTEAIEAASLLPNGSGDLLTELAEVMLSEFS